MTIKKGFTLAEVMVTLGILGVLAAIIIPAVMNVSPDTNRVMLKKAYSTLEKSVSNLINDDAAYPGDVTQSIGGVTVPAGFNNLNTTGTTTPGGQDKFCYLFVQQLNTVGTVNYTANSCGFTTTDGIHWNIWDSFALNGTGGAIIGIDVNGAKPPNCQRTDLNGTTCAASVQVPDGFVFDIRYDGKITAETTANPSDIDTGTILVDPTKNKS